jgi:hypothetical protein
MDVAGLSPKRDAFAFFIGQKKGNEFIELPPEISKQRLDKQNCKVCEYYHDMKLRKPVVEGRYLCTPVLAI